MNSSKLLAVAAAIAMVAAAGSAKADTLSDVQKRGILNCGVNVGLTGFAIPDDQGHWHGLSVDVCRAIASAIFGDDTKIKYVPLGTKERFTALQSRARMNWDWSSSPSTFTTAKDSWFARSSASTAC